MMKTTYLMMAVFTLWTACKQEQKQKQSKEPLLLFNVEKIKPDDVKKITPLEAATYKKGIHCKYEYRTGKANAYKYNYEVKGNNLEGRNVTGHIAIEGKNGAGILKGEKNQEIKVEVQWIGRGKLKGVDNRGNEYFLYVE